MEVRNDYEIDGVTMGMNMDMDLGWEDALGTWPAEICTAFA